MQQVLEFILKHPEVQAAIVGFLTWAIIAILKKGGILPHQGEDFKKRLTAVATAALVGIAQAWLAHIATGAAINWPELLGAIILAWFGATGLHTLTKPKPG